MEQWSVERGAFAVTMQTYEYLINLILKIRVEIAITLDRDVTENLREQLKRNGYHFEQIF